MDELDELKRRLDVLSAKEEIRDVLYRYNSYIDRLDAERVKTVYHPDADDVHWGTFIGNAHEFADYITEELRDVRFVTHEVTNPLIQLEGDRAFVESRYTSRVRVAIEGAPAGKWLELVAHGRYLDLFEQREGAWKIAHRRIAQDGSRVSAVTDVSVYNPEGSGRPAPDDLIYRGFDIMKLAPAPAKPKNNIFKALQAFGRREMGLDEPS